MVRCGVVALVALVALFPLLWLVQRADDAGGLGLALVVLFIGVFLIGGMVIVAFVASIYALVKTVRGAVGLAPPQAPKLIK